VDISTILSHCARAGEQQSARKWGYTAGNKGQSWKTNTIWRANPCQDSEALASSTSYSVTSYDIYLFYILPLLRLKIKENKILPFKWQDFV